MNLWGRSIEDWSVVIVAALYVYIRHSDKPPMRRASIVAVSGVLAVNLSPEFEGAVSWVGPRTTLLLLLVGIWALLDIVSSVLSEREEIAAMIMKRIAGGKGK